MTAAKNDLFLDKSMRGWIKNYALRNYWRVAAWYDIDDLIQDGYLCYYKCKKCYRYMTVMPNPTPDDKRKFMALVKAAFANHIIDLANSKTGCPETAVSQVAMNDATTTLADLLPVQHEESTFRTLLASAPKEVTRLVELIMKGEARVGMTNKYYCRKLGLNPNMNLPELIRQHFCMM